MASKGDRRDRTELVLQETQVGEEHRRVSATVGEAEVAVLERSTGPDTEAAYGTLIHGHKLLVDRLALSQCLGVEDDGLAGALQAFFAPAEGDAPLLSDLMDQLDVAEVRYTYLAWTGEGDAVLRPGNTG